MAKIKIPQLEIIYREVFAMKPLYVMIHEWLMEYNYKDETGDVDHKFMEEMYLERRLPVKGGGIEKELRIWWRTLKNPGGSSYKRWRLNVYIFVIYMKDVEVMHEGKKIKAHSGELRVVITPTLELDYQKKWENHPILKHFHKFFMHNMFNKELEGNKKGLYRDAYRLHGAIKNFLEQRYFVPEERRLHEKLEQV